jgi:hypothetical protein
MRILFTLAMAAIFVIASCKSSSNNTPPTFCDTTCNNDTIRVKADNKEKSFVRISMNKCEPDSITWGTQLMDAYRQMQFATLAGKFVKINKDFVRIHIFGTSYAWLMFNECVNGQGFIIKLPFNDTANIFRKLSAFNPMDPKYKVHESLVAYTDKGNIFVEEMATGKKAMMTFGSQTDMEYDNMHATVESVQITPTRIWAKVKIDKEWKEIEKNIKLE